MCCESANEQSSSAHVLPCFSGPQAEEISRICRAAPRAPVDSRRLVPRVGLRTWRSGRQQRVEPRTRQQDRAHGISTLWPRRRRDPCAGISTSRSKSLRRVRGLRATTRMKALELPTRGYADEEARAWQPVAVDEHGDEHKSAPPEPAEPRTCLSRVVAAPLVPDAPTLFGRTLPAPHVRLAKFFALSYVLLLATHAWIRAHGNARKWERDADYSLADFHLLDLDACAGDVLWFFVVGRWWRRPGVDSINFLAPAAFGCAITKTGSWRRRVCAPPTIHVVAAARTRLRRRRRRPRRTAADDPR
mmetsp:Transcript_26386/g.79560  ORF Transcript_26386/g.79560 Transcript_26386/m.79560 type:complete len:303 (-) Transcript_26386:589-1497(-)